MTLQSRVIELLKRTPQGEPFVELLEGRLISPLTDYRFRPIQQVTSEIAPDRVEGMNLFPLFTTGDWYVVYCIEMSTGRFFALDPENMWPPNQVFTSCAELLSEILRIVSENETEEVTTQVREFLRL